MGALIGLIVLVTLITVAGVIYFLPSIVAAAGQKRKAAAIFVLNLFLGWTFLGWVLSLVWAIADERSTPSSAQPEWLPTPTPAPPATPPPSTWRALPQVGQRVRLLNPAIVRVAPEPTARSTDELKKGTDVTVLRTDNTWAWVRTESGEEGWVEL